MYKYAVLECGHVFPSVDQLNIAFEDVSMVAALLLFKELAQHLMKPQLVTSSPWWTIAVFVEQWLLLTPLISERTGIFQASLFWLSDSAGTDSARS